MKQLKVLACAYTCSPTGEGELFGGGEDVLGWNIVNQLARFHNVWVLAHTRNKRAIEAFLGNKLESNLHFHYFELPKLLRHLQKIQGGIQVYAFIWQLWAYVEARKLHALHKFEVFHHITYANDWMASYVGATFPGLYIRGPGGGAHKTPKEYLKLYSVRGRIWERIRSIGQNLFRLDPFFILGQNRAKALLVCNHEAYEALPMKWRRKASMMAVCGVSKEDVVNQRPYYVRNDTFQVITAGKLLGLKGFGMAIEAFALFSQNCPHSRFTIVGDGPELLNLRRLARDLDVDDRVEFLPWQPRSLLLGMMAQSDVFLFPSLRDGGGAVVVEAMSAGTPVICLDISGPSMHVTEHTGIKIPVISPEKSIEQMATALKLLHNNRTLIEQMGSSSRLRAEQIYHWDRVGERLQKIYQEMMEGESTPN